MTSRLPAIAATGWLLVALLAVTIRLPYRQRRRRLRQPGRSAAPARPARQAWWAGLRVHYWLGYAIAALALLHGTASMTRGIAGRAHPAGLRLASLALLVALGEVGIGLWLRGKPQHRAAVRRIHFWVMTVLVVLVVIHVALDSWLLGTFHGPSRGDGPTHRGDLPRRRRELVQPHPAQTALKTREGVRKRRSARGAGCRTRKRGALPLEL